MTRKRRIALAAIVSGAVVTMVLLYLFTFPVDLSRFHSRIEAVAGPVVGRELRLRKIVLKALPSPDLTVEGLEAFKGGEEAFSAEHLRARVSLWPLLLRRTVIERLEIRDASLFVKRSSDGRLNIEDLLESRKGKKSRVTVNSLYLQRGSVKVLDESASRPALYEITEINGYLYLAPGGFTYGAGGRLRPSTMITVTGTGNPTSGNFEGSGSVEGLDTGIFNPYFKKAQGSSIDAAANAEFSYRFGEKNSLKCVIMYSGLKAAFPAVLNNPLVSGSAILDAEFGEKRSIRLHDIRIELPDFTLRGSFGVEGGRGSESFTLKASSTPVPAKTFKDLIPVKVLSAVVGGLVRDITPLGGAVTVKDFTLSGPFKELKDGTVFARPERFRVSALLNGLSFRFRNLRETFDDFAGPVSLADGVLSITGLTGRYNMETLDDLTAELSGLAGPLTYSASVDASLDTGETLQTAKDLFKDDKTGIGKALERLRAGGDAVVSLKVSGSLKGKTPASYSGTAEFKDASFSYSGLPGSFKSIFADIAFDNRRVTVNEARGREGDSDFTVTGFVEDYFKTPSFDFSAEGDLTGNTVKKFLPPGAAQKLSIDGKVKVKASGSGTRKSFAAAAYLDTTGAAVEYKNVLKKAPDYTLGFEGFIVLRGTELEVHRADLHFGTSSVTMGGDFLLDRPVYSFVLQSKDLKIADFDDVSPFLIREYESGGLITFRISATKKTVESGASYQGVAMVKDGRFKSTLVARPVERINAAMMIEGNRANIKVLGMEAGRTRLSGAIDIPDVAGRVVDFSFTSPHLDTDDLIPKEAVTKKTKEAAARAGASQPQAHPVTGRGEITIKEGSAWGHPFKDLSAKAELTSNAAVFNPVTLSIDGGTAEGSFSYFKDPGEALLFETDFRLKEIDLETVFNASGVQRKVLTGRLDGTVRLAERRGSEPFSAGLQGSAALEAKRGRLWKVTILTKIFSLVNILSIDELFKRGLPYRTLSGDFSMDRGIISTEKMTLESDSLRMSAVGEISVPEKKIDAVLAMSPFVTIDKIVSEIPLAGWIIAGKDQSVVSMYFGIDGELKDPLILPKPITMIEKGVFGIFQRILETPERLLMPEKNEKNEKK
ncbi:MAG: AsmA-like C-terminal domain-containing protein [Deltaproteobacteria bacterium]|nr:AsmA-like C-terminal domain-containing protein [Deltaproteobacteria bacterium]